MQWEDAERPGYFGRKRDERVAALNEKYGEGKWRLVWRCYGVNYEFEYACQSLYEGSYFFYLANHPEELAMICQYGEVIDNAMTNIQSGLDYRKQESYSTHIQDIAIRNAIKKLGKGFMGPPDRILEVRSKDSNGFRFSPGRIPFAWENQIMKPSLSPWWASPGSVEDFWQSNKIVQVMR